MAADPIRINSNQLATAQSTKPASNQPINGPSSFADALANAQGLKFSNHAQKRLQSRNISLTDEGIARLTGAVEKAQQRGGRESLVLMDDMAFIVNVKDRMVVTALDSEARGQGVFTQIDSVVFADPTQSNQTTNNEQSTNNEI
jgi:flagellar operon protein